MAARRIDPRLIKLNRTYDVAELARRLGVHRNTVRHWQREGLRPLDGGRPVLFHGSTIRDFLGKRIARRKSPCPQGTLYCSKCRETRPPALGMIDYVPISATGGNVREICATCETVMHRRTLKAALPAVMPGCDVEVAQAPSRLRDRPPTSLNCDFRR
jgi:hypothetical protein